MSPGGFEPPVVLSTFGSNPAVRSELHYSTGTCTLCSWRGEYTGLRRIRVTADLGVSYVPAASSALQKKLECTI